METESPVLAGRCTTWEAFMYKVLEMAQPVKNLPANAGDLGSNPWVGKIHRRRDRLSTLVFWPGEFNELHSPRGGKELDTTEPLSLSS